MLHVACREDQTLQFNPLRTNRRLVKMNEVSIFKPIRDIVRMVV